MARDRHIDSAKEAIFEMMWIRAQFEHGYTAPGTSAVFERYANQAKKAIAALGFDVDMAQNQKTLDACLSDLAKLSLPKYQK